MESRLPAVMGGAYGGAWFDPAAAVLHVGVTSPAGRRAAEAAVARAGFSAHVVMTPVRWSWGEILATQKRWNRRLARLFARNDAETAPEPRKNAVDVILSSSVTVRERVALKREAAASHVTVLVTTTRAPRLGLAREANVTKCNKFRRDVIPKCDKPITPGVGIIRVANRELPICTAGPLVMPKKDKQRTYLLTAGHCVNDGLIRERWLAFNTKNEGLEIGPSASYVHDKRTGDVGVVKVNNPGAWARAGNTPVFAVTAAWEKASETSYSVTGQKNPQVGDSNCVEGAITGGSCGIVRQAGVTIDGIEQVAEDETARGQHGDSGAPVIAETEGAYVVEGTLIGAIRATGNLVFEPFERAQTLLKSLSPELVTTANEVRPVESAEEKSENEKIEKLEKEEQETREKEEKENPLILPAPTLALPLVFTSTGGKATFETALSKIECKESSGSGLFVTVREGSVTLTLHGCALPSSTKCSGAGEASGTILELGAIKLVGLDKTKATLGSEIEFGELEVECGSTSKFLIEGQAIGEASGVESGKSTKLVTFVFKQEKGKQAITKCQLAKPFCEGQTFELEAGLNGGLPETAGLEVEQKLLLTKEAKFDF
jgi:hypothetical protein